MYHKQSAYVAIYLTSLQYLLIVADGDNGGILLRTDGDLDVISSLGGHESTQLLSVTKACPSSHR